MKRGDIYLVSLDPSEGREQQGTRPVLVISADPFNSMMRLPIVVPITSGGDYSRRAGYSVPLAGTRTVGVVLCDQPRPVDLVARKARRLESAPASIVNEVLSKVATIFE